MQYPTPHTTRISGVRRALALALWATILAACDPPTEPDPDPVPLPLPERATVRPEYAELYTGEPIQLTFELRNADGQVEVLAGSWSSSNPAIAEVSSTGRVRALREGRVLITATNGEDIGTAQIRVLRRGTGGGDDKGEDEKELRYK